MINCNFVGHLARNAEKAATANGKKCVRFTVGTNVGFGDKKHVVWMRCIKWGDMPEYVFGGLTRGACVSINGELDITLYTNKKNEQTILNNVTVSSLEFAGKQNRDSSNSNGSAETDVAADDDGIVDDSYVPF